MPGRQVHALAFDPLDQRRLAFQLGASLQGRCCEASRPLAACGWSGVLDLTSLAVTHIHCPEPPWRVEVRLATSYCRCAGNEASDRASAARSRSGPSRIALAGRLTVHSFAAVRMQRIRLPPIVRRRRQPLASPPRSTCSTFGETRRPPSTSRGRRASRGARLRADVADARASRWSCPCRAASPPSPRTPPLATSCLARWAARSCSWLAHGALQTSRRTEDVSQT